MSGKGNQNENRAGARTHQGLKPPCAGGQNSADAALTPSKQCTGLECHPAGVDVTEYQGERDLLDQLDFSNALILSRVYAACCATAPVVGLLRSNPLGKELPSAVQMVDSLSLTEMSYYWEKSPQDVVGSAHWGLCPLRVRFPLQVSVYL